MRLSLPLRAIAAASLLAALAACGLFKGNEEVQAIVNKRVIGMPVGDFFDRYGRPRTRSEKPDGGMEYDWISAVPYAKPGVEGLDERVCKLALTRSARSHRQRRRALRRAGNEEHLALRRDLRRRLSLGRT